MKKGTNDNNDDNASVSNTTIASLNTTLQRVEKSMVSHASDHNEDSTSHQRTFDDTQASAGSIGEQFIKRRRKD